MEKKVVTQGCSSDLAYRTPPCLHNMWGSAIVDRRCLVKLIALPVSGRKILSTACMAKAPPRMALPRIAQQPGGIELLCNTDKTEEVADQTRNASFGVISKDCLFICDDFNSSMITTPRYQGHGMCKYHCILCYAITTKRLNIQQTVYLAVN